MRVLTIGFLLVSAVGCASVPHKDRQPAKIESTERYIKVCAFNLLTGLMLLPTQGISAFESPICEENEKTKDVDL